MIRKLTQHLQDLKSGFVSKGTFTQNLALTFSGNVVAQVFGFLFTPFIAHIYGPEVYGLFALFMSITNNLSPLATLQFPAGYVVARNEDEFQNLLKLTFLSLIFFTGMTCLLTYLFSVELLTFFNAKTLIPYAVFIPLYIFFIGFDFTLLGWNIRLKEFKRGAFGKVLAIAGSKGFTVGYGFFIAPVAPGMIVGNLLSYPFESLIKFSRSIRNDFHKVFQRVSLRELNITFQRFRAYPLFVTTGSIINNISNVLPIYYFSAAFTQSTVGYFALASSLVTMPVNIIVASSTTVFLQRAADVHLNAPDELKALTHRLYKRLFWPSFVALVIFALVSEWAFVLVFGETWRPAGVFASFLAITSVFSVPANPLSVLFRIVNRERTNFIINVSFTILKFAGLFWGIQQGEIIYSIIGFSLASMISYGIQLFCIFDIVKLNKTMLIRDFCMVLLLFLGLVLIKL